MGQAMDLNSKGKALTLDQLNTICFYKTGIAFEAALVMPAILAQVKDSEISSLKAFAYHAGIAFQIKDDLLDLEGNDLVLGKPAGQDVRNNNSTFVSILGEDGAKKQCGNIIVSQRMHLPKCRSISLFETFVGLHCWS